MNKASHMFWWCMFGAQFLLLQSIFRLKI